ncbi:MAG: hypothetical protein IRY99_06380 [Isosphaeraceae bacterium]|nr:hypothetical protein [Isosphaeraceae bacterium]
MSRTKGLVWSRTRDRVKIITRIIIVPSRQRRGEPGRDLMPVATGEGMTMDLELKRDAKGVIERIVHLRDSL